MRKLKEKLLHIWRPRSVYRRLDAIEHLLHHITEQGYRIMATLDDVVAAVQADTAVSESAITLLEEISQMLKDAQAANDPAAFQAVVDMIDQGKQRLADAVVANTPSASPPPPTPTPNP